jgi:CSLREA domain-containing protein
LFTQFDRRTGCLKPLTYFYILSIQKENNMKTQYKVFVILLLAALAFSALGMIPARAAGTITVNTNTDVVSNNGVCSLREAITNANADNQSGSTDCAAGSGTDTITFAGNYTITLAGSQLPAIASTINITGNGSVNTVIQANAVINTSNYRVFEVSGTGNLTLNGVTVKNGLCNGGCATDIYAGGGALNNGILTVKNSLFADNWAANYGGAIYNLGALTIADSTFMGGFSSNGGALFNNTNGTASIVTSTFTTNVAINAGGAIYQGGAGMSIANTTISGNQTNNPGGPSTAQGGGGVFIRNGKSLDFSNTILANSAIGGDCLNDSGLIGTNTNNLVEDGSCSAILSGDPMLGALADNGGPTQTFALLPGSPAIDAGAACPATDQRGKSRVGTCDIGAFESGGFTLAIGGGDGQSAMVSTAFANPLQVTVTSNASPAEPVDGGSVDFTVPAAGASATLGSSKATIAAGSASVSAAANDTVGGPYAVTANTRGASASVDFSLTNTVACTGSAITVNNASDNGPGSLREAIANICPSGMINFDIDYTIHLASPLVIDRNLLIDSGAQKITLSGDTDGDGNGNVRVFEITPDGSATLSGLTITKGYSATNGGGIANSGVLMILSSTISGNKTDESGGGIYNTGSLLLRYSTLAGNQAVNWGGGIANDAGTVEVINSTLSGNSVDSSGGGIGNYNGTITLSNSTFSDNSAAMDGGGNINNRIGTLNYANTILANATGGDCFNSDTIGTNIANLVEDGTCSATLSGDPKLAALANNGGPTWTRALQFGSPAIDAGDGATCESVDQRGVSRALYGQCDIGAYEYDIVDSAAPVATIQTGPAAITNKLSATFTFTGTDDVTLPANLTFECGIDGGFWLPCVSPKTFTGLTEGAHQFWLRTTDESGKTSTEIYHLWQIKATTVTYTSVGAQDGWVLESTETSNVGGSVNATGSSFQLGDDIANRQYKAILSFNTAPLPDTAVIKSAVLKIKQFSTPVGTNPFSILGGLLVDIRKGFFGTSALQTTDFSAAPSAAKVATINKVPQAGWYSANISLAGRNNIFKTGTTQFRLYFTKDDDNNKADADYMMFVSGNPTSNKPQLVISYLVP